MPETRSYATEVLDTRALSSRPGRGMIFMHNTGVNQHGEPVVSFVSSVFVECSGGARPVCMITAGEPALWCRDFPPTRGAPRRWVGLRSAHPCATATPTIPTHRNVFDTPFVSPAADTARIR